MNSENHTILVTGGAGFIGSNYVNQYVSRYPAADVVVLDALTYAGNKESIRQSIESGRCRFINGNICDYELVLSVMRDHGVNRIVHFAAESHVDRSIHGPDIFVNTNIVGTHNLLKAAKVVWLDRIGHDRKKVNCRFHHVSTDEVYGSLSHAEAAFTEENAYKPNSPYSASKAASDHLVRAYHETYGLPITISNCSNNYGPYQYPEKLIPLMILNMLQMKPLPVYGDGKNIRDWLHVSDHCNGINVILEKGKNGETYNIGGNSEITNIDLVNALCAIMDEISPMSTGKSYETLVTFVKDRPGHDLRYAIDSSKMKKHFGWEPKEQIANGMKKTVRWYLENMQWISAVKGIDYGKWMDANYASRGINV
jgi:dTDP-glucose 4,6-dehydratase